MKKKTLFCLLWVLLVVPGTAVTVGRAHAGLSGDVSGASPPVALAILVRQPEEPLVRHAGEEVQRYVRKLFKFNPPSDLERAKEKAGAVILLGGPTQESLSSQEYVIRPIQYKGNPALLVAGGSPRATLWAAYEVVSAWGMRYLVQGDVFPDSAGPFRLPDLNVKRQPIFPRREFRILNEMANSGIYWSLEQHKRLFDQLAKLRFTGVFAATYQHHPWAHFSFRGVERTQADICYGFRHRIHPGTIGRELLGSGQYFTNPDFQGAETYEERLVRGRRFMSGLIEAAHARGLEFTYTQELGDLPEELTDKLPELSAGVKLPEAAVQQPKYSRLGLQVMGGDPNVERYKTPLNPVFIDLVEASLVAHIQAYPNADYYGIWESEFPPGGAGPEECWRALNVKYHLEAKLPLQKIKEAASKQFFYSEGRALRMALGSIQTLRMLDILVNERNVLRHSTNPNAKIVGTFFSEHVQPLIESVLPPNKFEFMGVVDYLPARVAERMHTLSFAKTGKVNVLMTTTIEDDNVGFLPQLTTPSLHKIVQKMREYSIKGFMFRQFDISQHEPSMAYLIESAWDASVTPADSYRRYALQVAGEDAADDFLEALRGVEHLTEASNALISVGFMMPSLYKKNWQEGVKPNPAFQEYVRRLSPIADQLQRALSKTAPRGRKLVENYLSFIRFARHFVLTQDLIRGSRVAYDEAQTSKRVKDFKSFHKQIMASSELLFQALAESEKSLKTWTTLVVDPTDLGTLAGLNSYGHDWLWGMANMVYWESQNYGFSL